MTAPDAAESDPSCSFDDTLFTTFERQQRNPRLDRIRYDIGTDLLILPKVNLNAAEKAAREAISRLMPGPFGRAIERQVLASFHHLAHLRSLVPSQTAQLQQLVDDWHAYLDRAVAPGPKSFPTQYILTAFSLIEDYTLTLTQDAIGELVEAIADREGITQEDAKRQARRRADAGTNSKGGPLDQEIWDGIDILALIITLMNKEGLKPVVRDLDLQAWVIEYFSARASISLGGAAGNEAYILRQMGFSVLVHSPYHHAKQALAAPDCAKRLAFGDAGPVFPFPLLKVGDPDHPQRTSFVLQLIPEQDKDGNIVGPILVVDGQEYRPKLADRVILLFPNPRTDGPTTWHKLRVIWKAQGGELCPVKPSNEDPSFLAWDAKVGHWVLEIDRRARIEMGRAGQGKSEDVFKNFLDNGWPYLPIFQHLPRLEADGTLTIELTSAGALEAVAAEVGTVLLGGIQVFGRTVFTKTLTDLLRVALVGQLRALGSRGASMHFELSGVDSGEVLSKLAELCRAAGTRHISTNREELVQITSQPGSPFFVVPRPIVPESPFAIYWRAARLLKELGLDTYYVHDLDLDILVWRSRFGENPAMVESALKRSRQSMLLAKAAVPEALIRRAQANQEWDLILSTQSLIALLSFADEYAGYIAKTVNGVAKEAILEQIHRHGYHYHPDPDGISVVVAPTVFVDFCQEVSMAGAGDMGFAARACIA